MYQHRGIQKYGNKKPAKAPEVASFTYNPKQYHSQKGQKVAAFTYTPKHYHGKKKKVKYFKVGCYFIVYPEYKQLYI